MLLTRLSIPGARLFGTTNPDGPQHWLKTNYLDRAALWLDHDGQLHRLDGDDRLNLSRFSFKLADNPNLSPQYMADVSSEFTGLWYRRLILGEWCLAEGVVYESWDPARHVVAELPAIPGGSRSPWTTAPRTRSTRSCSAWASTVACTSGTNGGGTRRSSVGPH
ncbi:hypothetical protein [Streptosporangium canum]|uniref:hypothetical protein n=1 Tax=Streptosporangium canum TaxID=324952 RepID=UPI0033B90F8A